MCHVLVIEDEALIAMFIEDVLLEHGATSVSVASTEEQAIAAAQVRRPDFITSDVTLAEGSGIHAVTAIEREHGCLPVLFITATPDGVRERGPVHRVTSKPFDPRLVANAFREMARA